MLFTFASINTYKNLGIFFKMARQSSYLARAVASSWLKEDFARISVGKQAERKLNKQKLAKSDNAKK